MRIVSYDVIPHVVNIIDRQAYTLLECNALGVTIRGCRAAKLDRIYIGVIRIHVI